MAWKTILPLVGSLAVLCAAARADPLVAVGDDALGLTVQSADRTPSGIHVRVLIENLSSSHAVFLHLQPNRSDAQDYFYVPLHRTDPGSTIVLPIAPAGTRSAEFDFRLKPGDQPGLLVLGEDRPPFAQVAVALPAVLARALALRATPRTVAEAPPPSRRAPEIAAKPVKRSLVPISTRVRKPSSPPVAIAVAKPMPRPARRPLAPPRAPVLRHVATSSRPAPRVGRMAARPVPRAESQRPSVIFLPPTTSGRIVAAYRPPLPRFGQALILWAGHAGSNGFGWTAIQARDPALTQNEIAYAATYPHQIWTDGRTYLFVRWGEDHGDALVLQVAGDSVLWAQRASYDDLVYWLGPGRIYPRLIYQGGH